MCSAFINVKNDVQIHVIVGMCVYINIYGYISCSQSAFFFVVVLVVN